MTKMPSRAARPSWAARETDDADTPSEEEAVFIPKSFHPPPEGIEIYHASPAGLLARGIALFPAFPRTRSSVAFGESYRLQLRGQPWLRVRPLTTFPLRLLAGTDDSGTIGENRNIGKPISRQHDVGTVAIGTIATDALGLRRPVAALRRRRAEPYVIDNKSGWVSACIGGAADGTIGFATEPL